MTRSIRLLAAALVAAAALAQGAQANPPAPDVPGTIAVAEGNKPFLAVHADGVQVYSCNGQAWSLVAPRANLYDRGGELVGTHFGGPTWQWEDGSSVIAKRDTGVNVDPTAIDWLRLSTVSATEGRLAKTTFIQRINTTAGRAPDASECDAAGKQVEIPYTADYVFWKAGNDG
jgi:Protein of unknown function (DUF3455)